MMVYDPFGVIGVKIKVRTCSFHVTEKGEEKMGLRFLTNFFLEDKKAKCGIFIRLDLDGESSLCCFTLSKAVVYSVIYLSLVYVSGVCFVSDIR